MFHPGFLSPLLASPPKTEVRLLPATNETKFFALVGVPPSTRSPQTAVVGVER